jgi:hypothetical protein
MMNYGVKKLHPFMSSWDRGSGEFGAPPLGDDVVIVIGVEAAS